MLLSPSPLLPPRSSIYHQRRSLPMPRKLALTALALGALTAPLLAQQKKPATAPKTVWPDEGVFKWAPRPTVSAITANDLRTRLYQISDDSMHGRKIGEIGNYVTTAYIAGEFKRLGLKPAGENGTYFQNLPYGFTGFELASSKLTIGSRALAPKVDWIPMAPTASNGAGAVADLANVPTVFAGRLGDVSVTLDPALFKGKVAVFLAAPTPVRTAQVSTAPVCSADEGWPNQRGAWYAIQQAEAAAARNPAGGAAGGRGARGAGGRGGVGGAAAATDTRPASLDLAGVIVIEDAISPAAASTAFGGRGSMQAANPAPLASGPALAAITPAIAAKIFNKPVDQLTVGTTGQPVSASWRYEWRMSDTPGRNVIAVLPGSDPQRATEYVLVGAHNDHNGVNATAVDHDSLRAFNTIMRPQGANDQLSCLPNATQQHLIDSLIRYARSIRPPRRDSIMNGADDDGSGTVVLLEIAEKFAKEHPARSIIFISHEGEEAGLLGSAWFTSHPTIPLDSVVAAHNMDMLGKGRVTDVAMGGPSSVQTLGSRRLSYEFGNIIDSVNAISAEPMAIDKTWDIPANPLNRFCRSDQVNYVKHNIPVTYFSLGYARDYHQPTDEPQYVDYDHAARLARFIHSVMTAVADRADRPAISGADPTMPSCGR